jgi:hypothetical protein
VPQDLGVGSHVPILAAAVARTSGRVLEFGTGWWSTPMLHWMCKGRRNLQSFETDFEWFKVMAQFTGIDHTMQHVIRWDEVFLPPDLPVSVAFVDCSVDATKQEHHRARIAKRLAPLAHFVVCHDTEADIRPAAGDYGWAELDGVFKYQSTFKGIRPWTTVYSNFEEFVL